MHSQHATQCSTSANMHCHMGEGLFRKKKFYKDANQIENFIGVKTENDLYYRVKNIINFFFNLKKLKKLRRVKNELLHTPVKIRIPASVLYSNSLKILHPFIIFLKKIIRI